MGLPFNLFCFLLKMWSDNEISWREIYWFKTYMMKMYRNEIFELKSYFELLVSDPYY
jgi:hypothetical protein